MDQEAQRQQQEENSHLTGGPPAGLFKIPMDGCSEDSLLSFLRSLQAVASAPPKLQLELEIAINQEGQTPIAESPAEIALERGRH